MLATNLSRNVVNRPRNDPTQDPMTQGFSWPPTGQYGGVHLNDLECYRPTFSNIVAPKKLDPYTFGCSEVLKIFAQSLPVRSARKIIGYPKLWLVSLWFDHYSLLLAWQSSPKQFLAQKRCFGALKQRRNPTRPGGSSSGHPTRPTMANHGNDGMQTMNVSTFLHGWIQKLLANGFWMGQLPSGKLT